jgi:Flp pilus assembly protein TadD
MDYRSALRWSSQGTGNAEMHAKKTPSRKGIIHIGHFTARALLALGSLGALACEPPPQKGAQAASANDTQAAGNDHANQGVEALRANDYAKAKQLFTQARTENPKEPRIVFYLAIAEHQLGNKAEAINDYRAALAMDPKLTDASVNLSALLLDLHTPEAAADAVQVADAGLKYAPTSVELAKNRAVGLADSGNFAGATQAYAKLVADSPQDLRLRYDYARVLSDAGQVPDAVAALKPIVQSNDPKLLAAAGSLDARLGAFPDCVAALDKAIQATPTAAWLVNRGDCKRELKDLKGERADYEQAIQLDGNYAPAHLALGLHLQYVEKDKAKALASLQKAKELGQGTPVAGDADMAIKELTRAGGNARASNARSKKK